MSDLATQNQAFVTLDRIEEAMHDGDWQVPRAANDRLDDRLAELESGDE